MDWLENASLCLLRRRKTIALSLAILVPGGGRIRSIIGSNTGVCLSTDLKKHHGSKEERTEPTLSVIEELGALVPAEEAEDDSKAKRLSRDSGLIQIPCRNLLL
jgi:hypothetical protein